jgi:3-phenylpropionate/cinnamic acid dioxygenase small subunit
MIVSVIHDSQGENMSNEALDRALITDLLSRYTWALVDRDWDTWQKVFTPDAHVDYSTAGGPVGSPAIAAETFSGMMAMFDVSLSSGGNVAITFDNDDTAKVRSIYTMTMRIPGDQPTYMQASGWYNDTIVRTPNGWLISNRFEQLAYVKPA